MNAHATELRDKADIELEEQIEDTRVEFTALKEDGLADINRLCDEKVQELDERTKELVASVEEETALAYTLTQQKLGELVGEQKTKLVTEIFRLEAELRRQRKAKKPAEEPVRRAGSRHRQGIPTAELAERAASVPLEAEAA